VQSTTYPLVDPAAFHLSPFDLKRVREGMAARVKLEEMVRITDTGCELVGRFPFEEQLLR
jgi:hypothetical protein